MTAPAMLAPAMLALQWRGPRHAVDRRQSGDLCPPARGRDRSAASPGWPRPWTAHGSRWPRTTGRSACGGGGVRRGHRAGGLPRRPRATAWPGPRTRPGWPGPSLAPGPCAGSAWPASPTPPTASRAPRCVEHHRRHGRPVRRHRPGVHARWPATLAFLSQRSFDPVYDTQSFDMSFPYGEPTVPGPAGGQPPRRRSARCQKPSTRGTSFRQ